MRTFVNTDRQIFIDNPATTGALLRGTAWVNQNDCTASIFRFACTALDELSPRDVANALVQTTIVPILHLLNCQVLEGQQLKAIDKLAAELMGKVKATVSDALVNVLHRPLAPLPFQSALLRLAEFSLRLRQRLLILAEEARVLDLFTVGECSKVFQTHINTNDLIRHGQWLRFHNAGETGMPVAAGIAVYRQRLGHPFQLAMHLDSHVAHFGEAQLFVAKKAPVAFFLRIREGIVAVIRLEARVSGLLATFHAAKEGTKGQVDAFLGILHRLSMAFLQPHFILLPLSQHLVRVIAAERFLPFLPSIATHFQRLVIDPATSIQRLLQGGTLRFGRKQAIPKRLSHGGIITEVLHKVESYIGAFITRMNAGALCARIL